MSLRRSLKELEEHVKDVIYRLHLKEEQMAAHIWKFIIRSDSQMGEKIRWRMLKLYALIAIANYISA